jgi:hypothetical protein
MKWVGHVMYMGEIRNTCNNLGGKPELGRPEKRWEGVDWIDLVQGRGTSDGLL